jgi:hypothetical protein
MRGVRSVTMCAGLCLVALGAGACGGGGTSATSAQRKAACSVFDSIEKGIKGAPSPAGVPNFLESHQSLVSTFAADAPHLPASIHTQALALATFDEAALHGNPAAAGNPAAQVDDQAVAHYCGTDQPG